MLKIFRRFMNTRSDSIKEVSRLAKTDFPAALKKFQSLKESCVPPDHVRLTLAGMCLKHTNDLQQTADLLNRDQQQQQQQHDKDFARRTSVSDNQVEYIIAQLIDTDMDRCLRFYKLLLDRRFIGNKDQYVVMFIRHLLEREGLEKAITVFHQIVSFAKVKSLAESILLLQFEAIRPGNEEQKLKVDTLLTTYAGPSKHRIIGYVMLFSGRGVEWADSLHVAQKHLTVEDIRYLCMLSTKQKSTKALESLLDLSVIFKLSPTDKSQIHENMIRIHGKRGDLSKLEQILRLLVDGNPSDADVANMKIILHFYKCSNVQVPVELYERVREFTMFL